MEELVAYVLRFLLVWVAGILLGWLVSARWAATRVREGLSEWILATLSQQQRNQPAAASRRLPACSLPSFGGPAVPAVAPLAASAVGAGGR